MSTTLIVCLLQHGWAVLLCVRSAAGVSQDIGRRYLQVRHGAVLGLAELLIALRRCAVSLTPLACASVAAVVPDVVAARLLLGKGGELMRGAACRRAALHRRVQLDCHTSDAGLTCA